MTTSNAVGRGTAGRSRARRPAAATVLALAFLVLAPAAAQAGTLELVRLGSFFDRWTYTADAGEANAITISAAADPARFVLRDAGEDVDVADSQLCPLEDCGCTGSGSATVECPRLDSLTVSAGNRNDTVRAEPTLLYNLTLEGDGGADRLQGGAGADGIDGGSGDDPELTGQGGDDHIRGGLGADGGIAGGPGTDTLSYEDRRTAGVSASLATGANSDGDRFTAMEALEGSRHADTLVGSPLADVLTGLAGDDTLAGGAGPDALRAGDGNDTVDALDRVADSLDCGEGGDTADLDVVDAQVGCEVARRPDSDADGFDDGADCDIADPAVNPGAPEVPDNGVDENCDGIAASSPPPDRDGDGVDASRGLRRRRRGGPAGGLGGRGQPGRRGLRRQARGLPPHRRDRHRLRALDRALVAGDRAHRRAHPARRPGRAALPAAAGQAPRLPVPARAALLPRAPPHGQPAPRLQGPPAAAGYRARDPRPGPEPHRPRPHRADREVQDHPPAALPATRGGAPAALPGRALTRAVAEQRPAARTRAATVRLVVVLGAVNAIGPLSIDMYLPAFPDIARDLDASAAQVQLTLTACVLGLALGQLVIGP